MSKLSIAKVHALLDSIGKTSSILDKKALLKGFEKEPELKVLTQVFKLIFEPDYVFGIKDYKEFKDLKRDDSIAEVTFEVALELLEERLVKNKLRGHAAKYFINDLLVRLDESHHYLIEAIITKQLRINIGIKLINSVFPGMLMDKHYMGAVPHSDAHVKKLFDSAKKNNRKVYSQEKMDGMYVNFNLKEHSFISRNLKKVHLNIPNIEKMVKPFKDKMDWKYGSDVILNGELLIEGFDRYTSNGLLNSISKIEEKLDSDLDEKATKKVQKEILKIESKVGMSFNDLKSKIYLVVWDVIPISEFNHGIWRYLYMHRYNLLKDLLKEENKFIKLVPTIEVETEEEAMAHYYKILLAGGEGTIIKSQVHDWKSGKPIHQIKLKFEMEVEMEICGYRRGDPGTKYEDTLGAYIVKSHCGSITTKAPGLSEDERAHGWANQSDLMGAIISVKCNGLSQDKDGTYSLLHPRFNGHRPDKDQADDLKQMKIIQNGLLALPEELKMEDNEDHVLKVI